MGDWRWLDESEAGNMKGEAAPEDSGTNKTPESPLGIDHNARAIFTACDAGLDLITNRYPLRRAHELWRFA